MLHKLPCTVQTTVCIHVFNYHLIVFLFCVFLKKEKKKKGFLVHSCNIEIRPTCFIYVNFFSCKALVLVFDFIFVDMIKKKGCINYFLLPCF